MSCLYMLPKRFDQDFNITPHKWFATCKPYFADAMCDEALYQRHDFIISEEIAMRQKSLLFGHAIGTTEVAPVSHGYP